MTKSWDFNNEKNLSEAVALENIVRWFFFTHSTEDDGSLKHEEKIVHQEGYDISIGPFIYVHEDIKIEKKGSGLNNSILTISLRLHTALPRYESFRGIKTSPALVNERP